MEIKKTKQWFSLLKDHESTPIPPGVVINDEAGIIKLCIRLCSTAGQRAAWWRAGEMAHMALNQAPYEPFVRAYVREFVWYPPGEMPYYELEDDVVVQGGKAVINFLARVRRPVPDPVRGFLKHVQSEFSTTLFARQGGLEIRRVFCDDSITDIKLYSRTYSRLFNHVICGEHEFAYRVFNGVAVGYLRPAQDEIVVLSPAHDHVLLGNGEYLLIHPLPASD